MKVVKVQNTLWAFFLFIMQACSIPSCGSIALPSSTAQPPKHTTWDNLLKKHVNKQGMVDYEGFKQDKQELGAYLKVLENQSPDPLTWTKAEQLAYWINAYNAYTIMLVLEYYPISSIKDIGLKVQLPFVNTPWDIKFIKIAGEIYDLNNLEHNIIRKEFNEPRIHFALVCAAKSCPKLRNEAYTAENLDKQLTEQARDFLRDPQKNKISSNEVVISKLFSWYKGDFTQNGSLIDFLNQFTDNKIASSASIKYMVYDWSLNKQAK